MFKIGNVLVSDRKLVIEVYEDNLEENIEWDLEIRFNDKNSKIFRIDKIETIKIELDENVFGSKLKIYKKTFDSEMFIKSKYIPSKIDWVSKYKYQNISDSLIKRIMKVIGE